MTSAVDIAGDQFITTDYSGPITFSMVLNNKKIKVPAQLLINFPEKHTFEVRAHVYSGRALTSPDVSGYCSKSHS